MEIVNGDVVTRKRKSQALRGDYLKITKDGLRKELKQRGLRASNKRHEMIRKLEKWELDRRAREAESSSLDPSHFDLARHSSLADSEIYPTSTTTSTSTTTATATATTTATTATAAAAAAAAATTAQVDFFCGSGDGSLFQMSLLQENAGRSRQNASNKVTLNSSSKSDTKSAGDHHLNSPSKRVVDLHTERQGIVVWKRPFTTSHYFVLELIALLGDLVVKLWRNKGRVSVALVAFISCVFVYRLEGDHQQVIRPMERTFLWCAYWVGLGILSSVGLGTGLHTFLLYLGPHIAAVTLAASTCKSLDFPEPPYPDEIVCPEGKAGGIAPGILAIMSKVRLEAFMWGAGTALGELPPYFMARAARISGEMDEDELEVLEEMKALEKSDLTKLSFLDRAKLAVEKLIEKVGFLGILACASIPNPLFDVAGFMCGHFLVPFRTFFGATLIGKAVIKMHIQKLFVIFAFDGAHVEMLLNLIKGVPVIGPRVEAPFEEFLQKQKDKLHRKSEHSADGNSMLSQVFEKFVLLMVLYFLVSIVNSMAQNYHKRMHRQTSTKHGKKY